MISGNTRLAAVIATPIKHSISPLIHNTAFEALGIDAVYLAFELGPEKLQEAFETIKLFDMLGVNLSMPNKQLGFELVDEVSEVAQLIGSINTVVNQDGKLIGHNTDGAGFMASLKDASIEITNGYMTILGAGGAAISIIAQAAFDGVKHISVFNRKDSKFDEVKDQLIAISKKTGASIMLYPLEDEAVLEVELGKSSLLVNATSVGMSPNEDGNLIGNPSWLHKDLAVADVIYQPRETTLLKLAKKQGCQHVNGLGMLLHQAALAFELWTGQQMPLEEVRFALKNK